MRSARLRALPLLAVACGEPAAERPADSAAPAETGEAPYEDLFAFAVLADPHLSSDPDHADRLSRAVEWLNQSAADRAIELVWVVGDIGWSGGLELAESTLGTLTVPYLPVIGDNEVYFGDEQTFDEVFSPQYEALASALPEWRRGAVAVEDPSSGRTLLLQNFSFTYGGLRMVGLDWCSREDDPIASEMATLHDLEGGTLPFLEEEVSTLPAGPDEGVLLFSHHPMIFFPGGFYEDDMARVIGVTAPAASRIAANYAGHLHVNVEEVVNEAGYDLFITDATHDDELTVRVVTVSGNGSAMRFRQELVILP